jgi:hypothetical protein
MRKRYFIQFVELGRAGGSLCLPRLCSAAGCPNGSILRSLPSSKAIQFEWNPPRIRKIEGNI